MLNYNNETGNELWNSGYVDCKSSYVEYVESESSFNTEVYDYVQLMKQNDIKTIVNMNKYLTSNNLWNRFPTIRSRNTYANGFIAIGVEKHAYSAIAKLYKTQDIVTTHLIRQSGISNNEIKKLQDSPILL